MALVDVVVVSHNSASTLRACVEPLTALELAHVVVVDNGSADGPLETIADLPLAAVEQKNVGFAGGCNAGWRVGTSPFVLFLNPDAYVDECGLRGLVAVLETHPDAAIAAPRIVDMEGRLSYSLRRFPRFVSTYAQALYLHRVAPTARWADEIVRSPDAYEREGEHQWASGACLLLRRSVLERLGGWDDGFFLYCEDIDLCRRVHDLGFSVRYEPRAVVVHDGGCSAPRSSMLPHLAASRLRYARLHRSGVAALAERLGIALEATTRMIVGRGGRPARIGHARSLRVALVRGGRV